MQTSKLDNTTEDRTNANTFQSVVNNGYEEQRWTPQNSNIEQLTVVETEKPSTPGKQARPYQATAKLTRKQQAFVDHLLTNPKASATQAVLATYNTVDPNTAAVIASENLIKPNIAQYLMSHADTAVKDMIDIAKYSKELGKTGSKEGAQYASVAVSVNKDILDRVHGKATQRIESQSTSVTFTIDLSGQGSEQNK